MDVINFISKEQSYADAPPVAGQRYVNAFQLFADGPRIHEYLAEMHERVFEGRERAFLTVGETPGVTTEEAIREKARRAEEALREKEALKDKDAKVAVEEKAT